MNPKERMLDVCDALEDAIIIGRLTDYPDVHSLVRTRDYMLERGEITPEELTQYQLKKLRLK